MKEFFRIYALCTFGLSGLYALIYLVAVFEKHRAVFSIIMGFIAIALIIYWFRDGGVKQGWDRLDDSLIIVIILALVSCVLIVIATFHGFAAINTFPQKTDHTTTDRLLYLLRITPIILAAINVINLLIFLATD